MKRRNILVAVALFALLTAPGTLAADLQPLHGDCDSDSAQDHAECDAQKDAPGFAAGATIIVLVGALALARRQS